MAESGGWHNPGEALATLRRLHECGTSANLRRRTWTRSGGAVWLLLGGRIYWQTCLAGSGLAPRRSGSPPSCSSRTPRGRRGGPPPPPGGPGRRRELLRQKFFHTVKSSLMSAFSDRRQREIRANVGHCRDRGRRHRNVFTLTTRRWRNAGVELIRLRLSCLSWTSRASSAPSLATPRPRRMTASSLAGPVGACCGPTIER